MIKRAFTKVLDINKIYNTAELFTIARGDTVQFSFTFTNGETEFPLNDMTKARLYAKRIKSNGVDAVSTPLFSKEITYPSAVTSVDATFTSSETAGAAGQYLLTIILFDADGNAITTSNIPFELFENGYAGIYQPAEDFRDECMDALAQAQTAAANAEASATYAHESLVAGEKIYQKGLQEGNAILADCNSAKTAAQQAQQAASQAESTATEQAGIATENAQIAAGHAGDAWFAATKAQEHAEQAQQAAAQAVEITDPEGWRTDTRAMIARLAITKSDNGTLYFTRGSAEASPNLAFDTLSVVFKTDFDFSVVQSTAVLFPFYFGLVTNGRITVQYGARDRLRIRLNDVDVGFFERSDIAALTADGLNALAFVFKRLADGNLQASLFVNGVGVQNRATETGVYPTFFEDRIVINRWGSSYIYDGTVRYSDFRIFSFDVSATDAPYSLADYQAGKRLPPDLSGVQLALENYTIDRNTTTKLIKDASGNGQDATVSGSVAGDTDRSIAAFVDELKTQISQQS